MSWITARLKESSTRAGIISILSLAGLAIAPGVFDAGLALVIAAANLYQVVRTEQK